MSDKIKHTSYKTNEKFLLSLKLFSAAPFHKTHYKTSSLEPNFVFFCNWTLYLRFSSGKIVVHSQKNYNENIIYLN